MGLRTNLPSGVKVVRPKMEAPGDITAISLPLPWRMRVISPSCQVGFATSFCLEDGKRNQKRGTRACGRASPPNKTRDGPNKQCLWGVPHSPKIRNPREERVRRSFFVNSRSPAQPHVPSGAFLCETKRERGCVCSRTRELPTIHLQWRFITLRDAFQDRHRPHLRRTETGSCKERRPVQVMRV